MTKSTQTLLLVLGGVALVGGAGTAIYLATKKPATTAVSGNGSSPPAPNPTPNNPGGAAPPPVTVQTTVPEVNALISLLGMMNQPPPNWGQVQQ